MEVNKSKDGRLKNTILNSCCIQATISKYVENPYVYDKHETFEVEDIIEENTKPFFENVKKTKSNINSNNKKDGEAKDKIKNVKNSGDNNKNDKETKYTINNHLETKNNEITYEQDTNDDEKNLVLTNELSSTITSTQSEKDSLLKKISVN
uniref:Rhoptry protein n=1 Tax=Rhabditophanes sp. KR3021 TaxID=114890 RepID=A0AC35UB44_9BILA